MSQIRPERDDIDVARYRIEWGGDGQERPVQAEAHSAPHHLGHLVCEILSSAGP